MPIAVSEEHEALRLGALRWLANHCPPEESRAAAESPTDELPPVWEKMAAQGWLGLHVPEADGGQGFGLSELAVVLEELGHALFPGPVLPTVLAAALLAQHGSAGQRARYLPGLVDGSAPAALALGAGTLHVADGPDGPTVSGTLRPVLGLGTASVLLAPFDDGGWGLLDPRPGLVHGPARPRCHPAAGSGRLRPCSAPARGPPGGCRSGGGAPSGSGHGGRRRHRSGAVVPRDRLGVRQGARAVRPSHRPVPGHQARVGRHAGRGRAVCGRGLGCRRRVVRRDAGGRARPERAGGGRADPRRGGPLRQAVRPGTRGNRLHLGARRALLPQAGHGDPPAGGRRRGPRGRRGRPGPGRHPSGPLRRPSPGGRGPPGRGATSGAGGGGATG